MYVIFYNDKPIYLSDNTENIHNLISFNFKSSDIFELLNQLKNAHLNGFTLTDETSVDLYQDFVQHFKIIEAAGGLVFNEDKELLFIFRNGVWDLPKGKIEKRETIEEAALREVEEECGVSDLKLGVLIDKTYHIYEYKNQFFLK